MTGTETRTPEFRDRPTLMPCRVFSNYPSPTSSFPASLRRYTGGLQPESKFESIKVEVSIFKRTVRHTDEKLKKRGP